jgi:hypothetical protein
MNTKSHQATALAMEPPCRNMTDSDCIANERGELLEPGRLPGDRLRACRRPFFSVPAHLPVKLARALGGDGGRCTPPVTPFATQSSVRC